MQLHGRVDCYYFLTSTPCKYHTFCSASPLDKVHHKPQLTPEQSHTLLMRRLKIARGDICVWGGSNSGELGVNNIEDASNTIMFMTKKSLHHAASPLDRIRACYLWRGIRELALPADCRLAGRAQNIVVGVDGKAKSRIVIINMIVCR